MGKIKLDIKAPSVNIVIRTLNEEDWIKSCLTRLFQQDYSNFHITLVDSGSVDATLDIVGQFPQDISIINITDYMPGKAINLGAAASSADYIMVLSAHCLPVKDNLISHYVSFLESNISIAACYGRQLPLPSTHADDARDLHLTFSREHRIQRKDIFFHNANSMIRSEVWRAFPMNEEVKHIEDRVWATEVIDANMQIAYLPEASVYHEHGLHQHGRSKSFRAQGVLSVLNGLDPDADVNLEQVHGREMSVPLLIIANQGFDSEADLQIKLQSVLHNLPSDELIYVLSSVDSLRDVCDNRAAYISRESSGIDRELSVRALMKLALAYIENDLNTVQDALCFIDLSFNNLDLSLYQICRETLFTNWFRAVLPAWRDNGNFWIKSQNEFSSLDISYEGKDEKSTVYRSILGQGGCVRASEIRKDILNIQVDELICVDDVKILER